MISENQRRAAFTFVLLRTFQASRRKGSIVLEELAFVAGQGVVERLDERVRIDEVA